MSAGIGDILDESGVLAKIIVQQGEPVKAVRDYVGHREEVGAGARRSPRAETLVCWSRTCGNDAGRLPCPVMLLIPGSLSDDRLEQLS